MPIGIHTVDFDLRIATERLDSRESEFPPTPECVKIILKSTIKLNSNKLLQRHKNFNRVRTYAVFMI